MRILAFGTYPVKYPVHGGQRRIGQIGEYYRRSGFEFGYAGVYSPVAYSAEQVSPDDYPYSAPGAFFTDVPFIEDLGSGVFAANYDGPYNHFRNVVEKFQPDVIQLDQPFMWPLVKRLMRDGVCSDVGLIYSSQNVEAPLKADILDGVGVPRSRVDEVSILVEELERELLSACNLTICVSTGDAERYRGMSASANILVIRNGTVRLGKQKVPAGGSELEKGRYLFFVGSAYPPNIEGFDKYILEPSLYGVPPKKLLAVCGGAANGIYQSAHYQAHADSYGDRVHFFSKPSDNELAWLQHHAKGTVLPIATGGGSNLKTAEGLSSGKWIVATPTAMRSFEDFLDEPGVVVARTPKHFMGAMIDVIRAEPVRLTAEQIAKRDGLFWDRLLDDSGLGQRIRSMRSVASLGGRA